MYIKKKGTFISLHWFWFILYINIYILITKQFVSFNQNR